MEYYKVRRIDVVSVVRYRSFQCRFLGVLFPKVGKARIFYGAGPWASGQKKTPGREPGAGEKILWGFT